MRTEQKHGLYVPLAAAMRPTTLDDFVGHTQVLGKGKTLRRAIEQGKVGSLVLWGPPGVGKTTLAELIARSMDAAIERVSAVSANVKDLRDVLLRAGEWRKINKPTVLIVDEIHRFTKNQQDVLLPAVEEGLVIMIGATTENPYFEVVSALLSRAQVVRMEILHDTDITAIVDRALGTYSGFTIKEDARSRLVAASGGDARRALNILERAIGGKKRGSITLKDVKSAAHGAAIQYDKKGDIHYDTISAYIKSLRGSDPDAALFYLFRMVVAGEDPKFIIRRMFIFASEDIGNADPHALMLVSAAAHALEWVGLPEAEYMLAHATCYLAAAPKSNSVTKAMGAAKQDVELHGNDAPPGYITNAPIAGMKQHGKGVGYKYPHEYPGHVVAQEYRPSSIQQHIYYEPGDEGFEKEVKRRLEAARKIIYGE
jgi:putative ATPase